MSEKELLKIVDDNGNKIGTIERTEGIETGALLQAVQLWIINPRTNQILMQRRSKNKDHDPEMIDISVSGHVKADEDTYGAIMRETFEELGVSSKYLNGNMKFIDKIEIDFSKFGRKGKYITYEYLSFLDKPLEFYTAQTEEVDELFFMNYEEVKKAIRNKDSNMRIPYSDETEELFRIIDNEIKKYKEKGIEKE